MAWRDSLLKIIEDLRDKESIAIIGLGNTLRRDDGIGVYVASKLRSSLRNVRGVEVIVAEDRVDYAARELMKLKPNLIIVIDAMEFHGNPGDIRIAKLEDVEEPYAYTHRIPIKTVFKLMGIKAPTYVLGIQVISRDFGEELSEDVKVAGDEIVEFLSKILRGD
ncbi:MAG: hydrogenase maturation protease [Thaumarchaeota archaeon]|nr:hydrogenase maturation protease [Nitrososphaerota archaeon]